MNPKLEIIFARRSIRRYTGEPLTQDEIQALLEAGMAAPSASNNCPWHLVTVTNSAKLAALAEQHPYGAMVAHAAAAIIVCGDPSISPRFWVQDCSAATENILISASAMGLGAVWVGCYPHEDRQAGIRSVLAIPDEIGVLCMISIGRPAEEKPARTQYDASRDHREGW
jgi:nitroreductase